MTDFNLAYEKLALTDGTDVAFTTRGLAKLTDVPQRTVNDYFTRLEVSGNRVRISLEVLLAMGYKMSGNIHPASLYVISEQVSQFLAHFSPKYPKALQFLILTSQKGIVSYVAGVLTIVTWTSLDS